MPSTTENMTAPIAVVGMSCRLSGDVSTLDDFWTLLSRGRSGWREIPEDRFSKDAFYHPKPQKKGCFNPKGGYFMNRDFSKFDAPFFNITKQEAIAMDPQQRQILECTYEALENAGIPKESIAGRNIGVFIGGAASDYRIGTLRDNDSVPMFDATGNHQSIQAGRVSHFFDLRGPCFTLDTACSSGIYALHQAVQSIRNGDTEEAIVAGCNLHLQPDDWVSMSMLGIFNEHGKTFAFDHRAKSGFARGEGVGCLILKPLDQAIRDNDKIRSVIVNSGVGQDGKTVGLSTPNGEAQEALMREVYSKAGLNPLDVGFIEAHGTGTKVGDPIEAKALYNMFGQGRTARKPLYMGSVKTNVGHLENVSGIISIIKASLMLEKGFILPNLNFEKANPAIPFDEWNLRVPTTIRPWPKDKKYISVNNFGFGGSNAHCVLAAPEVSFVDSLQQETKNETPRLFVLSAHDEEAAKRSMSNLGVYIEQHPEVFQKRLIRDMAYTLGNRRSHLSWRVAVPATSTSDLALALNHPDTKPVRSSKPPKIAFVFTGQGAQWPAMGRELFDSHPVFADTLRAADECLRNLGAEFSLIEELHKDKENSIVGQAHISQPACTALQLALTRLLSSWGIEPDSVTGHSSGEIGAAFATGAISLDDAMAVAYFRGQATQTFKARYPKLRGAMLAVGAGADQIRATIKSLGLRNVGIACENSPGSITASGDEEDVDKLAAELERQSIFNRKLRVEMAYHSFHMELVAKDYMDAIKDVSAVDSSKATMFSSLRGEKLDSTSSLGPQYWVDNLTNTVLFSSALQVLAKEAQPDIIVEIGPHGALEGPIKQILKAVGDKAAQIKYFPSVVRNQDATLTTLKLAGNLFSRGLSLNFPAVNKEDESSTKPALLTDLAPYPWTPHQYWYESRQSKQRRLSPFARHDLLGRLDSSFSSFEPTWRNILNTDDLPWLKDHKMQSLTTFPLAGYLCMAVEAVAQRASLRGVTFDKIKMREISASRPLLLEDGVEYETVISLKSHAEGTRADSDEWDEFRISSWTESRGWVEHCRGLASARKPTAENPVHSGALRNMSSRLKRAMEVCDVPVSLENFYSELGNKGAGYQNTFRIQPSEAFKVNGEYSTSTITVPDTAAAMPHSYETKSILTPALTDLMFQLTFAILGAGEDKMQSLFMPSSIRELEISTSLTNTAGEQLRVVAHGRPDRANLSAVDFDIDAWPESGVEPVVHFSGFKMTPVKDDNFSEEKPRSLCYNLQWEPYLTAQQRQEKLFSEKLLDGVTDETELAQNGAPEGNGVNGDTDKSEEGLPTTAPIVIISERSQSDPLVRALTASIASITGAAPKVTPFAEVDASDSAFICLTELDSPLLRGMSAETFDRVQTLLLQCSSILWVSSGAYRFAQNIDNNIAQGLLRTIRSELSKSAATLDLDPNSQLNGEDRAALIIKALRASLLTPEAGLEAAPIDYEFAEEDGQLVVPRIVEQKDMNKLLHYETNPSVPYTQDFGQPGRRLKIAVGTAGALDSLYFEDDPEQPLSEDEIEIKVVATGMNFKDVVIAMGQVASPYLGVECSGTVARVGSKVSSLAVGDRVCAVSFGAYSTYARCPATSAVLIPDHMSFEIAASVPVIFGTAYYGIVDLGRLRAGEKILIHAASGGVGQASIQLAQSIGAEIYATVGSAEKKKFIMDNYGIPEDHIFYSRSTAFGPALREATGGEGVDVVINSLAGDLLRETWECIAPFGRFIEIGKRDITTNTRLEMAKFEYNVSFSSVDLTLLAAKRPKTMSTVLGSVMALMRRNVIKPIGPITAIGVSEVEKALRLLQSGKTTGKMVVNPREGEQVKATHPTVASKILKTHGTYILIGGTGGLGRSVTKRLIQRGARNIVLLSRSGQKTEELTTLIADSLAAGANVHVKACDVADKASVSALVNECKKTMPPIRGVIHAAMVLRDVLFEKMTFEDYDQVVRSKIDGAWNFHSALLDTKLDFFIVFSSVAGIVGNRGQAAYAAANTYLDAFVHYRVQQGLPATSLDLTAIVGVGYLANDLAKQAQVLRNLSGNTMGEAEVLALVEAGIQGRIGQLCNNQCITGVDIQDGDALPYYASEGKFAQIREAAVSAASSRRSSACSTTLSTGQLLQQAPSQDNALEVVIEGMKDKLSSILMMPSEDFHEASQLTAYGLDSLNAIELRNWFGKELMAHLQVLELLTSGTLKDLATLILRKTSIKPTYAQDVQVQ